MRTDAWAALLAQDDVAGLFDALAASLGFGAPATPDGSTRRVLGIPEELEQAVLAAGPGTLRLLAVVAPGRGTAQEHTVRLATRLSRRAPHLLWLVVLMVPDRDELVVAAWDHGDNSPRLAALVVERRKVQASDAETMASLAGAMPGVDLVVHQRWIEILGRESISRRFFLALSDVVGDLASGASGCAEAGARREVAVLHVSRMIFLAFLEARGWLDGNPRFLAQAFDRCAASRGDRPDAFQRSVLEPLFFGTLNTPPSRRAARARSFGTIPFLNGGLFTRSAAEARARDLAMRDADWGRAFDGLLLRYRFTAREESSGWQESAIDPEILGRAFESLMAGGERRSSGVYYTPFALVERVTDSALEAALAERGFAGWIANSGGGGACADADATSLRSVLRDLRVMDPACGSGAFLVHVVDRLSRLRRAAGDERTLAAIRREVVAHQVFGVDINPTAVWLCELRLWLALMVDHPAGDPGSVPPLPNLDHNIRCGDALAGGDMAAPPGRTRGVAAGVLRARYARSTGSRKRALSRALDRAERQAMLSWLDGRIAATAARRRSILAAARGRDLFGRRRGSVAGEAVVLRDLRRTARELREQRRSVASGGALPFAFATHFPDAAGRGGFDLVVGNPPWIRLHRIPARRREEWRREFRVFREAAWRLGTRAARAGIGFGSQVDAASLFVERSHQLLRRGGVLALLVPVKLWRSLAGGGVRRLLMERSRVRVLEDWSGAPAMFDAAAYPSIVVASSADEQNGEVELAVHRGRVNVTWRVAESLLPLDESPGAPWLPLPPEARAAFDRLTRTGVPLAEAGLGQVTLGVKCGLNEAFVVRAHLRSGGVEVTDGSRTGILSSDYVRPLLRGDGVRPWRRVPCAGERLVFPCTVDGRVLATLPPELRSWLLPWRKRLLERSDARGRGAWWSLFRLEGARSDRPRVVWADIGRSLQALVLPTGDRTVPVNTCYVLRVRDEADAFTLAALLNSPVADAWVGSLAEPLRGGYRRHFAWTMARLPVPDDWARAREVLAPLGERGANGDAPGPAELLAATLEAFRLRERSIAPLVEWINA